MVERVSCFWLPLTVSALVLGTVYTWYYFGENYAVEPVVNSAFSVIYGWVTVLAVFAVMKR